jgi:inner membrane protein
LDNVTHTLVGVTLARTPLGRAGRGATLALVLASNAPDVDVISLAGGAARYMHWHRGPTHGPLGVVGLGCVAAAIAWLWEARRESTARASFPFLVAVAIVGAAAHVLMDLPTSYGTRIFSPFDWHWYAFDWMPIIDIYLLIALGAGLFFGRTSPAAARRNAAIVLMLIAANYGVRAVAHHRALALAPRVFGPALPARCPNAPDTSSLLDRWPRDERGTPHAEPASRNPKAATRCLVEVAAVPTFLSPLDWRLIAQASNAYDVRDVSLTDARFRASAGGDEGLWRQTVRYPNVWTPAAVEAAAAPLARIFLGFSRFPAARSFTDPAGVTTVRFIDMRFAAGLLALEQPIRRPQPFSATIRIGANGAVIGESLGR